MEEKIVAYVRYYMRKFLPAAMFLALTVIVSLSLWSFRSDDISFFYHATGGVCQNQLGYFGATLAAVLVYLFGVVAYAIPFIMFYALIFISGFQQASQEIDRIVGLAAFVVLSSMWCRLHTFGFYEFSGAGGLIGSLGMFFLKSFDYRTKDLIVYILLFGASVLVLRFAHLIFARWLLLQMMRFGHYAMQVDHAPARIVRAVATGIAKICTSVWIVGRFVYQLLEGAMVQNSPNSIMQFEQDGKPVDKHVDELLQELFGLQHQQKYIVENIDRSNSTEHIASEKIMQTIVQNDIAIKNAEQNQHPKYQLPDIDKMLVYGNYTQHHEIDTQELAEQSAILEEKLSLFGVKGKVVRVHPGPVITMFEYRPDIHVKLSKIIGLEDDLAMALQALSIRIIAPIPGKDVVGFEVSNKIRTPVLLSNIFHGASWTKFKGHLPLILGEDVYGSHVVVDLASMPHLLIAGSTGSGKSVALNCMLVSLLCAKKPDELKLIIIDPKQIEFTAYEKVAHLLFPVITDSKKAVPVLKWVVVTMEERYERMAALGVKNIFEYQQLTHQQPQLEKMPFIVVIIDELADLMMTTGKDAEDLIARIAQMSRAAGIHMIVATQRPSVDVITGLIKVNFPNRISFKVTSKVDSRTILDEIGAERLLGKGDMLFIDSKDPQIRRVHGAYVSEKEVNYLVQHIQTQQPASFLDVTDIFITETDSSLLETDQELYQQVVELLKECDEVSISMIQRRFRIGYNRSARIIETLQAQGHIMPSDGGKMRRVIKD